ncbi:uncharacterized protein PV09_09409 [Verruconis gallopava]|uniref:Uncharacterized protein n=1 Tax=Verruconis gallopava TaxID=253628 RepID=A0A0D2AIS6_9PEZI|nr:uncharacterized protein PV09_09409 [Verruconis gallopava]KIV98838.1 hypothetical protein PV09_09409 [Verruconis gallopava]
MATGRLTGQLALGKGCTIKFFVDESQPADSIDQRWSEVHYDGEPDSWVPEIGLHWHKHHDELMKVLFGRVEFTLDGRTVVLTPEDEPLRIPRRHVHSFKFIKGEAATFTERTDPAGLFKQAFFEDLLDGGGITLINALRAFYRGDTYVALPGNIQMVDQAFIWGVGAVAAFFFPQKNKGMLA